MDFLLLALSVTAGLVGTLLKNSYSKHIAKNTADTHLCNFYISLVSFILFFIAALASGQPLGLYTAIMGVIFGMFTALCTLCGLNAYKFGPVSYTNLITMSSMIIPALSGAIFFGESIGILKIIGIALMLACIFLSVYKSDEGDKRTSLRWLLLCLGAALFCGLVGIMQKLHQSSGEKNQLMWFLCIAFAVSCFYSGVSLLITSKGSQRTQISKKTYGMFVICGVAVMLNNVINLYLSGVMQSIVFFPTVNGSNILLLLLISVLFLNEKPRPTQWIGIICGVAAIMLLCL